MQFYFSNIFGIIIIIPHDVVKETQAVDHVEVLSCVVVMIRRRSHDDPCYCVLSVDVSPGPVSSTLIPPTGAPGLYPFS
mgnify:FL=1